MIRRTSPAVSFTPSHRALMMRTSRPLLGNEMKSFERNKAAWNEIPFTMLTMSRREQFQWNWRIVYDLGLRDFKYFSKLRLYGFYLWSVLALVAFYRVVCPNLLYFPVYQTLPEHMKRENATEYARARGGDVWCGDGKFVTPYFHINPPMFTMKLEDL